MTSPPDPATGLIGPPRIATLGAMSVVGIHRPMSFSAPATRELWQAFRPRANEVGGRASDDFVSMRVFEPAASAAPTLTSRFEQWAAVEVTRTAEVPPGMDLHTLAGGTYAVFGYRGRASDFGQAARYIHGEWLPGSAYELAPREHFEILGPAYRPDDPDATEQVWIPIQTRGAGEAPSRPRPAPTTTEPR